VRLSLGLSVGERLSMAECISHSQFCEEHGFDSVWVAEGRLTRDGIVPSAVIAYATKRIKVGTGVVNNKTRNPALMAVTFKTLAELAPHRVNLGIGPWWEPLASRVGAPLQKPVKEMREYLTVVKALFRNETVDFDGEFIRVHDIRFDMMYRENQLVDVPIYIGAVGTKMLQLAGEIADGVLLDFMVPPSYVRGAVEHIKIGIARRTDGVQMIDRPQLVACSVDDKDPQSAIDSCKAFLTQYLAQQPHIMKHSGIEPDLVQRIHDEMGWPATPTQVRHTMRLVPNEMVQQVTACGTSSDAIEQLERYRDCGATCAVLCTLGDKEGTMRSLAKAAA